MLVFVFSAVVGYVFALCIYRVYFHPLARFPGPTLGAVSTAWLWREYRRGSPAESIHNLHRKHGSTVVRIAPNELHFSEPEAYRTVYSQKNPLPKSSDFYNSFLAPHTIFTELDPARHRELRKVMSPSFSRSMALKMEPLILEHVYRLSQKIFERRRSPINIFDAFRSMTTDITSEFMFGKPLGTLIHSPTNFRDEYLSVFDVALRTQPMICYHPIVRLLQTVFPVSLLVKFDKTLQHFLRFTKFAEISLHGYKKGDLRTPYPILFDAIKDLPDTVVVSEAVSILVAGSNTASYTLAMAVFYILRTPKIRKRLVRELDEHVPDPDQMPPLPELEKISYLRACVREALRVAAPIPGRLPRILPEGSAPLEVDGKLVPPGTTIGMSAYSIHFNEELWGPDCLQFNPDRWEKDGSEKLERYLVTFSRGARACLGQNFASAEIFLLLSHIFRKYDMTLETFDVTSAGCFIMIASETGIRVRFNLRA